jgi:hypothetical protein
MPAQEPKDPTRQREIDDAYQRGLDHARLDNHEARLATINGSIDRTGTNLGNLIVEMQALRDDFRARDATAQALKEADAIRRDALAEGDELRRKRLDEKRLDLQHGDEDRRAALEQRWSPLSRWVAVIGVLEAGAASWISYLAFIASKGQG